MFRRGRGVDWSILVASGNPFKSFVASLERLKIVNGKALAEKAEKG